MALDIIKEKGVPIGDQKFTWKEMVRPLSASWMMMPSRGSG